MSVTFQKKYDNATSGTFIQLGLNLRCPHYLGLIKQLSKTMAAEPIIPRTHVSWLGFKDFIINNGLPYCQEYII